MVLKDTMRCWLDGKQLLPILSMWLGTLEVALVSPSPSAYAACWCVLLSALLIL